MRLARYCCLLLALPATLPAQTRGMTEDDLLRFHWVADPRISPDGNEVAYTLVKVNETDDRYETSLWVVAADGKSAPRRLTPGPHDGSPRWSPDGHLLAFVRTTSDTGHAQIYLLRVTGGGEARQLTDLPKGTGPAVWSPDSKTIAFTSSTLPKDSIKSPAKKSDVHIITRAVYRDNDEGWIDPERHDHIWVVDVDPTRDGPAKSRQLTSGDFDEEGLNWSPDGTRIVFMSDRVDESYYENPDNDVFAVPAAGGPMEKVADIDGPMFNVAPWGKSYAFMGWINPAKRQSFTQNAVFVAHDGAVDQLTKGGDAEMGSSVAGDQHPPRGGGGQPIVWSTDGKSLIFATTVHGESNLTRIDIASHKMEPVTTGQHDIVAYSATPGGGKFALTMSDVDHLSDLYVLNLAQPNHALMQLTHVNDSLWAGIKLGKTERFTYKSFDGTPIEAWVTKPPDFTPGKKYPLILNIHGGPHAAYGETFFHEFQVMAARGYVVLAPNPRGSTSYGEAFGNIIQYHYPGDDYKDLMVGVDTMIARGYIDDKRLCVTGGSGGGLLTNWTVTQTNRFVAAASQRSIADWAAWWYTADFTLFTPSWFREPPFKDPQEYAALSPITFVDRVNTPLLLIEGEADSRTPSGSGGMTMFRALKMLHKPTEMVVFPGETHELSRSGKPAHRVERIRQIITWFDKYLARPAGAASAGVASGGSGE